MIFHHALDQIFGQRAKLAVLRFFVRGGGSHSGRQIALRVGLDPKTCHGILRDLLEHSILDRQKVGAAYLYSLREEHVLVKDVLRPAFEVEETLLPRYAHDLIDSIPTPVLTLLIFGSIARAEEAATSDIDLFLVVPDEDDVDEAEDQAAECAFDLVGKYGNTPQVIVYDVRRFQKEAKDSEGTFVREVLRTGRVAHGLPLTDLLSFQWPADAGEFLDLVEPDFGNVKDGGSSSEKLCHLAGVLGFYGECGRCSSDFLDAEALTDYLLTRFDFSDKQSDELQKLLLDADPLMDSGFCGYCDHGMQKDD